MVGYCREIQSVFVRTHQYHNNNNKRTAAVFSTKSSSLFVMQYIYIYILWLMAKRLYIYIVCRYNEHIYITGRGGQRSTCTHKPRSTSHMFIFPKVSCSRWREEKKTFMDVELKHALGGGHG